MITSIFTAALTFFLVRALGPSGYGVFTLALGVSAVLFLPADFGISQSTARFVAERIGRDADVAAVLAYSIRIKLLMTVLVAVGLFLMAGPISALYDNPDLAWPLRASAIALFGQSLMQTVRQVLTGIRKISRSLAVVGSEAATEFSASLALVLLGTGAAGAMWGRAIGYAAGALIGLWLLSRMFEASIWKRDREREVPARQFVGYAGAMLIVDGAFALFSQIDVLLIGSILGATATGIYGAPIRLTVLLGYPGQAVASGVAPSLASEGDGVGGQRLAGLERSLHYMIMLQSIPFVFVLLWAGPIVDLTLGPDYEDSKLVLMALAPFIFLRGISPVVALALNFTGEARRRIPIAIAALGVNVVIDLALLSEIGVVAASIGTDVAYAVYVGAHFWICQRVLGLRTGVLALSLARVTLASTLGALVLLVVGTSDLSVLQWALGLVLAPLAMVGGMVVVRELELGELRAAFAWLRAKVRPAN